MRRHSPIATLIAAFLVTLLGFALFGGSPGEARPNTLRSLDPSATFPASVLPPSSVGTPASAARANQFFFITLGAIVRFDGTVVRAFPTGGVAVTRLGLGRYRIMFNRNVRQCLQLATIRTFLVGQDEPSAEYIHVAVADSNPNTILVETQRRRAEFILDPGPPPRSVAVAGQRTPADSGFNIAVFCPFF
jgi:hypothetical protein